MSTTEIAHRDSQQPEASKAFASALVDVFENKDEYLVIADVPGAKKEDLSIAYQDNQLRLVAGVKGLKGAFEYRRVLNVGADIDAEKVSAELDRGVLRVHLPKAEAAKPRQIPVKVG